MVAIGNWNKKKKIKKHKIMTNKELTLAQLMRAMIKYDGGDAPRIQHFVKVHDFARIIAIAEGIFTM